MLKVFSKLLSAEKQSGKWSEPYARVEVGPVSAAIWPRRGGSPDGPYCWSLARKVKDDDGSDSVFRSLTLEDLFSMTELVKDLCLWFGSNQSVRPELQQRLLREGFALENHLKALGRTVSEDRPSVQNGKASH